MFKHVRLSEDRHLATKQWNALSSLCDSQEEQLTYYRRKIKELEDKLTLCSHSEIDALYDENERLTELLENKSTKAVDRLAGCCRLINKKAKQPIGDTR